MATPMQAHTPIAVRPVQIRNAGGTWPGIHGNTRRSEQNSGSDVARESLRTHAAPAETTMSAGSTHTGGSNPIRTSSPPEPVVTASAQIESQAARPAHAAARSGVIVSDRKSEGFRRSPAASVEKNS